MKIKIKIGYANRQKAIPDIKEELVEKAVENLYDEDSNFSKNIEKAKVRNEFDEYIDDMLNNNDNFSVDLNYKDYIIFNIKRSQFGDYIIQRCEFI